jgi:hypothetical protein
LALDALHTGVPLVTSAREVQDHFRRVGKRAVARDVGNLDLPESGAVGDGLDGVAHSHRLLDLVVDRQHAARRVRRVIKRIEPWRGVIAEVIDVIDVDLGDERVVSVVEADSTVPWVSFRGAG